MQKNILQTCHIHWSVDILKQILYVDCGIKRNLLNSYNLLKNLFDRYCC